MGGTKKMEKHHPEGPARLFAVVIIDEHDPHGTTVHTFTDPELWAWLHRVEVFPDGIEVIEVPIPGADLFAHVTRWDPLTDKAQNLVWLPGTGGQIHPRLTALDLGPSGTDAFRVAYARLRAEAEIVEGLW